MIVTVTVPPAVEYVIHDVGGVFLDQWEPVGPERPTAGKVA